jgi:hypothetical protein
VREPDPGRPFVLDCAAAAAGPAAASGVVDVTADRRIVSRIATGYIGRCPGLISVVLVVAGRAESPPAWCW